VAVLLLAGSRGEAAPILFNFNSMSDGAGNSGVQSYMQGVMSAAQPGATVSVNGALGIRAYDGEGHVVGPVANGTVSPVTLATGDNGGFIANDTSTDRITLVFSVPVYSVSFDFEIFPDGTGDTPDFTFAADHAVQLHVDGVLPGTDGTYLHSLFSGPNAPELVAQLLGSASFLFPQGVTTLEFIDWPARIGIDNLQINAGPAQPATAAPEPASLALWGVVCLVGSSLWSMFRLGKRQLGTNGTAI
jgi:hypothetical protein